jgi:hypothetical protein
VVPEQNELVRLHVVHAVGHLDRGREPLALQTQDTVGDEQTIEAVGDGKDAQGDENKRQRIHTENLRSWLRHDEPISPVIIRITAASLTAPPLAEGRRLRRRIL